MQGTGRDRMWVVCRICNQFIYYKDSKNHHAQNHPDNPHIPEMERLDQIKRTSDKNASNHYWNNLYRLPAPEEITRRNKLKKTPSDPPNP